MVPIIDYGEIALVIPMIAAVGSITDNKGGASLNVFMSGRKEPIVVEFKTRDDAEAARDDLIAVIAHYYMTRDLGPDMDYDDYEDGEMDDEDEDDLDDTH